MAFVAPLIGAGASLGGAALGGKGQKRAAESQLQAQREALAFSREQEAQRQANYNRAYQIWDASRRALMERYGIDLGEAGAPAPPGAGAPAGAPAGVPPSAVRRPVPMGGGGGGLPPQLQGQTLGGLAQMQAAPGGEWNEWGRYGLQE